MKSKYTYILLGIVIGILLTIAIEQGIIVPANEVKTKSQYSTYNSDTFDAHFIEQMVPHHEDAVTMSNLALKKAKRPEVKQLANSIILSQTKEIREMKDWYKTWFLRELPSGGDVMMQHGMKSEMGTHMGMMGDETDLLRLNNASDFDLAYLKEMIPHHQMAVMMGEMLRDGTTRTEMKNLAENIIASQTQEIEMMRQWVSQWDK